MLDGCYLENFSYFFQPGTQMFSLFLSQSWKTYFSPSSFILLSVCLITFLLKNDLNMYIDVPLRALYALLFGEH
jgi:hypothetical protein